MGEPGSRGRALLLQGALSPVGIACSIECLTLLKSGLGKLRGLHSFVSLLAVLEGLPQHRLGTKVLGLATLKKMAEKKKMSMKSLMRSLAL